MDDESGGIGTYVAPGAHRRLAARLRLVGGAAAFSSGPRFARRFGSTPPDSVWEEEADPAGDRTG